MTNDPQHPFSVATIPCPTELGHFRWEITTNGQRHELSADSYPTEPMAAAAGEAAMQALVANWRLGANRNA
jgi:hypothetical protein